MITWTLLSTASDLETKVREHLTDQQLYGGGSLLGIMILISILKKLVLLALLAVVVLGVGVAYQSGAFDSALNHLHSAKR